MKLASYLLARANRLSLTAVLCGLMVKAAFALPATIIVDTAVLPATTNNTFTRIDFSSHFPVGTIPNVFTMTTDAGNDPCTVRIRNVDNTGFEAVCLEPLTENGTHPGMNVDYIAIVDGGVSVPLDGGGGNVLFQSQCTNTTVQDYSNNCVGCSGPRGSVTLVFPTPFDNAPSVLAQVQTTNNLHPAAPNDPVFLDVAMRNNSINANRVRFSLEQMEAGIGPLANPERLCYLAAERDGCQDLDLSSLGGPTTPITFNAVRGGANIDGWANGCDAGEGATFDACFTTTPIALAKQRERRGTDGGMLRRCGLNSTGILLTYDEDRIRDNERGHIQESASVMAFSAIFTTPVTLNQASVAKQGRRATFKWQTSAETFHLGFNLWGQLNQEWVQLNQRLINGDGIDGDGVRDYRRRVRLDSEQAEGITVFGISSVDNTGHEEFYGPFSQGKDYGEQAISQAVDWNETRANFNARMHYKGYALDKGRWRKLSKRGLAREINNELGVDDLIVNFKVLGQGVHSLSYADVSVLEDAWNDVPLSRIALTLNGNALPRHIVSNDGLFNAGDVIHFAGRLASGEDEIYLSEQNYQLRIDSDRAIAASVFDATVPVDAQLSGSGIVVEQLTSPKQYSAVLSNGDAWYDSRLLSVGGPASQDFVFTVPESTELSKSAVLDVVLFGGIDLPADAESSPDHHAQIHLNGELLEELSFDGFTEAKASIAVPSDKLSYGDNVLTITLPGDTAYFADLVFVDTIKLSSYQDLALIGAPFFLGDSSTQAYHLPVSVGQASVYAFRDDGALTVIKGATQRDNGISFAALPRVGSDQLGYAVGGQDSWPTPVEIELGRPQDLHSQAADYLIVSHPNFIGEELQEFADSRTEEGHSVRIVDWLEIVSTYGYGNDTPKALDRFLKLVSRNSDIDNLLLVGGNTYDYLNITGQDTVNFIPTHYRPVDIFAHTPTDTPYADIDDDGLPDMAVGRWPVRSLQDLQTILKKNRDWRANLASTQYQSALLIAQPVDNKGLDFEKSLDGRVLSSLRQSGDYGAINKVYLQDLIDDGESEPITAAREQLKELIDSGTELISFAGHASTGSWGTQNILNTEFIQNLENGGKPSVLMPLACYTTYYESPAINTLAHQWLFSGDKGAVAIHGATVLGDYRENSIFAERYLKSSKSAKTIGQAILSAKREMAAKNEMMNNWALLGDPSLPLR